MLEFECLILSIFILIEDFERNWNSGGNNSYNSFSGGNSNGNSKGNSSAFDRDFGGFNNFSNNSNGSGNGNFGGNDRFNSGGGGGNMNNGGGNQYAVHLRGMPYDCGDSDIQNFFSPLKVVNCEVLYNNNGKLEEYFTKCLI